MFHGDARKLFQEGLETESVEAVHVYFPDPWWKKRHHKRRIIEDQFLQAVIRVLRPGGSFHFWTDVHEYYEFTLESVARYPAFSEPIVPEEQTAEHDLDYRTHFERRTRLQRESVYRMQVVTQS